MKIYFRQICLMFMVFLLFSGTAFAANYIVAGASNWPAANGLYVENGTSDTVPRYIKGNWILERHVGTWYIEQGDPYSMHVNVYSNNNHSDLPPNDGGWSEETTIPTRVPGLTVTLDPSSIPSLSTWGILIMIALLSGIAIAVIRKRNFLDTGTSA